MSYSHNRLNLTPGSLYVDKLAVRHILPIDQGNNEYSTNTIFAVAVNGELQGYDPATWFSSIGYTDPSTIQAELVSTIDVLNIADRSTVAGLGSAGYVSLATLNSTIQSTVAGLTAYTPVSLDLFYNTINGLANTPYNYVSSTQLQSTVTGLASAGYVSTIDGILSVKGVSTGNVTTSTVTFRDILGGGGEKTLYNQGGNLYFGGQSLAGSLDLSLNSVTAGGFVRAPLLSTLTINAQNTGAPRRWVIAGSGASAGSVVYSTDDGASWSAPVSVIDGGTINKILYIAGRWYALGQSLTDFSFKYSSDGNTWTPIESIFIQKNANTIAYNGSYYLAGGEGGGVGTTTTPYISYDGINWVQGSLSDPLSFSITDIIYTGSRWIEVGDDSTGGAAFIKWSTDGFYWTNGNSTATGSELGAGSATSIATNGHTIVVGMANGTTPSIYYSTDDGLSWTAASNTFTDKTSQIIWNTSYYVAVGNTGSYIKYSRDGRTWLDAQYSGGAAVVSVFWNGRTHRAITAAGAIYQSTDGITWTVAPSSPFTTNSYITYSVDGRDTLIAPNVTLYGVDVPHYYNASSQIYAAPDKLVLNDTLTIRGGTAPAVGVMKGDPSAAYSLDVDGAINASTIYVSSVQVNDLASAGARNTIDFSQGAFRVNGVPAFESTVAGLGQVYVSTTGYLNDIQSTVAGLGSANYVSTLSLESTVAGLGSASYVSSASLQSTVAGLGQLYVSTDSLASTVAGLGSASYVSTAGLATALASTVAGLGASSYISSTGLQSTVAGLGSANYVSTSGMMYAFQSTITGLGSANYISLGSLVSTTKGLSEETNVLNLITSTVRLNTQAGSYNTPFKVDLLNAGTANYVSSIVRIRDNINTSINTYNPQLLLQGFANDNNVTGLGFITTGTAAQIQYKDYDGVKSTLLHFTGDSIGINYTTPDSQYALDVSGTVNIRGTINAQALNAPFNPTTLNVVSLKTSTIIVDGQGLMANYIQSDISGQFPILSLNKNANFVGVYMSTFRSGVFNGLSVSGDNVLYYANNPGARAGLVIGPSTVNAAGIRIDSSGNVGIGKSIPSYTLDVSGSFYASTINYAKMFTSTVYVGNANLSTNTIRFYGTNLDGPGQSDTGAYSHTVIAERIYNVAEKSELLLFKGNDADDRIRHLAPLHQFDITTTASAWPDASGNPPNPKISGALYIDNNGNVGVGTTSPSYNLDVSGNFNVRSGNGGIRVDTLGNPSIFSISGENFIIKNEYNDSRISIQPKTTGAEGIIKRYDGVNGNFDIINSGTGGINITPDNMSYDKGITLTYAGNIGVGTTTPGVKLDVAGAFRSRLNFVDVATAGFTIGASHYGSYVVVTGAGTITFPSSAPEGVVVVLINDSGGDRTLSVPGTFKGNNSTTFTSNTTRTLAFHGTNWYGL